MSRAIASILLLLSTHIDGQATQEIFTHKEAIALDQDPLGIEGFQYTVRNGLEICCKPLQNRDWAICFLNCSSQPRKIEFDLCKEPIADECSSKQLNPSEWTYMITDVWTKKYRGTTAGGLESELPVDDVLLLRLKKK
jgi:alpha-galactosidase